MNGHDFTREQNMEARMTLAAARPRKQGGGDAAGGRPPRARKRLEDPELLQEGG